MEPWADLANKPWVLPPLLDGEEEMNINGKAAYLRGIKDLLEFIKDKFPDYGPHIEREAQYCIEKLEKL